MQTENVPRLWALVVQGIRHLPEHSQPLPKTPVTIAIGSSLIGAQSLLHSPTQPGVLSAMALLGPTIAWHLRKRHIHFRLSKARSYDGSDDLKQRGKRSYEKKSTCSPPPTQCSHPLCRSRLGR